MSINPMANYGYSMPMMNFGATGDFYTDMLQQQLMQQYQTKYGDQQTQQGDSVNFSGNQENITPTEAKSGSTLGRAAKFGIGGAGLGAGAMYLFNHGLNNPVVTENGTAKFTDSFLAKFAKENAAVANEAGYNQLYKDFSVAKKFKLTPEKYQAIMEELPGFASGEVELKDCSKELKSFLKAHNISDAAAGNELYTKMLAQEREFIFKGDLNLQREVSEGYDDFIKTLKDMNKKVKKGGATLEEKVAYLKENAHYAGLDATKLEQLHKGTPVENEINAIYQELINNANTRKTALQNDIKTAEAGINKYARNFNTKRGFLNIFNKEPAFKNVTNKQTATQLENAFKHFRGAKAGKAALIVGGIGVAFGLLTKKKNA